MRSTSTRLKMSVQVSSARYRMPGRASRRGERVAVAVGAIERRQEIDAGEARERIGDAHALGRRERIGGAAAEAENACVPAARAATARIAAQSAITAS